jgi:hypothetical protein
MGHKSQKYAVMQLIFDLDIDGALLIWKSLDGWMVVSLGLAPSESKLHGF